jgi:hypothetical protein
MAYKLTKTKTKTRVKTKKHKYSGGSNVPPTLRDNLQKFANIFVQVFNNMGMYTLDKLENGMSNASRSLGIDPNKSFKDELIKVGQKAEQMNNALDTPEGKRALLNLTKFFNNISQNVLIPSSEKLTEGLIENLQPILVRGQNAVFALLSASPFGEVIDIPRFLSESLGVVEKSVSLADDVLDVGQESVDKLKAEKGNFDNVLSEFNSLVDQANSQVSSGLDSIQESVNNYGSKINDYGTTMNQYGTDAFSKANQYGTDVYSNVNNMNTDMNNSLKKYQNQSRMIGGRINKSTNDFFSSGNHKSERRKWSTRKRR